MHKPQFQMDILDRNSLDYVWQNMRDVDREELTLQCLTDANYGNVMGLDHKWTCRTNDMPFAVFGAVEREKAFWIYWFSTEEIRNHMKVFTLMVRPWLSFLRSQMFGKRCMVEVWEKHDVSVRWLKRLGFTEETVVYRNNERFLVMEHR